VLVPSRRAPGPGRLCALLGRVSRHWIRTEYGADHHAFRPCPHCQQSEKDHHDNQQPEVLPLHTRIMRPRRSQVPTFRPRANRFFRPCRLACSASLSDRTPKAAGRRTPLLCRNSSVEIIAQIRLRSALQTYGHGKLQVRDDLTNTAHLGCHPRSAMQSPGQIGLGQVIRRRLATGRAKKRTTDMSLFYFFKLFLLRETGGIRRVLCRASMVHYRYVGDGHWIHIARKLSNQSW
jgi:hypothetical protein